MNAVFSDQNEKSFFNTPTFSGEMKHETDFINMRYWPQSHSTGHLSAWRVTRGRVTLSRPSGNGVGSLYIDLNLWTRLSENPLTLGERHNLNANNIVGSLLDGYYVRIHYLINHYEFILFILTTCYVRCRGGRHKWLKLQEPYDFAPSTVCAYS